MKIPHCWNSHVAAHIRFGLLPLTRMSAVGSDVPSSVVVVVVVVLVVVVVVVVLVSSC